MRGMTKNRIITIGNALLLFYVHNVSLIEKKVLYAALAKIDQLRDGNKVILQPIKITAQEFSEDYGVEIDGAYTTMIDACEKLFDREVALSIKNRRGIPVYHTRMRWFSDVSYYKKEGYAKLMFGHRIIYHLVDLKKNFTKLDISDLKKLTSVFAWRLYEIMQSYRHTGWWIIDIPTFCEIMEAPPSCRNSFQNLKKRIIESSIEQLNRNNWLIKWSVHKKQGKKITHLKFVFEKNPQLQLL